MDFFETNGNLYKNPDLYDFVVNPPANETEYYLQKIQSNGKDVLELSCGTGRVLFAMLNKYAEFNYDGLDISERMLDLARKKSAALNFNANFYHGDMENFELNKLYDLIFIPVSGISYLHTDDQILNCLHSVKKHLKKKAKFILTIFNPSTEIILRAPHDRYTIKTFINPSNGREVLVEQSSNYDPEKRINYATHYYSYADQKDFFQHPIHLRMLFPGEVQILLEKSGFKVSAMYGNYTNEIFTNSSKFQIVECESL